MKTLNYTHNINVCGEITLRRHFVIYPIESLTHRILCVICFLILSLSFIFFCNHFCLSTRLLIAIKMEGTHTRARARKNQIKNISKAIQIVLKIEFKPPEGICLNAYTQCKVLFCAVLYFILLLL